MIGIGVLYNVPKRSGDSRSPEGCLAVSKSAIFQTLCSVFCCRVLTLVLNDNLDPDQTRPELYYSSLVKVTLVFS